MAEQLPNGDAPISADVEMKEEPVAEVQQIMHLFSVQLLTTHPARA